MPPGSEPTRNGFVNPREEPVNRISSDRARELLSRAPNVRVLVVGDLMLDRYLTGSVDRISPEAPVPVVRVEGERWALGGAGKILYPLIICTHGRNLWPLQLYQASGIPRSRRSIICNGNKGTAKPSSVMVA